MNTEHKKGNIFIKIIHDTQSNQISKSWSEMNVMYQIMKPKWHLGCHFINFLFQIIDLVKWCKVPETECAQEFFDEY